MNRQFFRVIGATYDANGNIATTTDETTSEGYIRGWLLAEKACEKLLATEYSSDFSKSGAESALFGLGLSATGTCKRSVNGNTYLFDKTYASGERNATLTVYVRYGTETFAHVIGEWSVNQLTDAEKEATIDEMLQAMESA